MSTLTAYCYRSGRIGFSTTGRIPTGAITIAESNQPHAFRQRITAMARHGYPQPLPSGRQRHRLFVPGIPESLNDKQAMRALTAFQNQYHGIVDRKLLAQIHRDRRAQMKAL